MKYKIAIIDDHPLLRHGLGQLINSESDMEVCGEAEDAGEGWEMIRKTVPDLVIIDITLKNSDGIEFISSALRRQKDLLFLVISMHDENVYAERAIRAGARGYIMKQIATEKVVEAIRTVLKGKMFLSTEMSARLIDRMYTGRQKQGDEDSSVDLLSNREFEIFVQIGKGYGTGEIATKLNLSVKTIETHRRNIKDKLQIEGSPELNRFAIQWVNSNMT